MPINTFRHLLYIEVLFIEISILFVLLDLCVFLAFYRIIWGKVGYALSPAFQKLVKQPLAPPQGITTRFVERGVEKNFQFFSTPLSTNLVKRAIPTHKKSGMAHSAGWLRV
jgi:hypothetical protein